MNIKTSFSSQGIIIVMLCCVIGLLFMVYLDKKSSPDTRREAFDYYIDTSAIPKDTVHFTDDRVSFVNGIYYLNDKEFSGVVHKVLKGYNVQTFSTVLKGKLHGPYQSFYENGRPYEVRRYRNNLAVGKQYGYWKDTGNLKFEYNYYEQKKEGIQKSWYATGEPYYEYGYRDDRQEGRQRAWRKNGSLFRNFVARNGARYGLQKSISCNGLSDEKIVLAKMSQTPKNRN